MSTLTVRVERLEAVGANEKQTMIDFALGVTPGLTARYVSRRLETYGFVASAWSGGMLVAVQLFDQRSSDDVILTYLGPVFSTEGAYIHVFAAIVRAHAESNVAFCIGMELESDASERALRRIMPCSAYPNDLHKTVPTFVRGLARRFEQSFDHIVGLDAEHLWTWMSEPMTPTSARRSRYQMALVPCLGPEQRELVLAELAAGLESLRRYRARAAQPQQGRTL